MKKIYLVLEQGSIFEGQAFGAHGETMGEIVFTTQCCGYLEALTDPAYYGQLVLQTFPMIGNYGVIEEDEQGECLVGGYIVREWCKAPSNFRCDYDLDKYLRDKGIVGICGVDTREITRIVREHGTMNAKICEEIPEDLSDIKEYKISGAVAACSCKESKAYTAENAKYNVTVIHCGMQKSLIDSLLGLGCSVTVVPYNTEAEKILAEKPDGVILSDGPGDPAENEACIQQIKALFGKVPMMGLGLGHQLLALAAGAKTVKMKQGHRGASLPVRDLCGTRTYITAQNHGYAVDSSTVPEYGKVNFANINDGTCEGIDYPEHKAFSVQFRPNENCFEKFIDLMGGKN